MKCLHCDEENGVPPNTKVYAVRRAVVGDIYPDPGCIGYGMRFKAAARKAWGRYRFSYSNFYGELK